MSPGKRPALTMHRFLKKENLGAIEGFISIRLPGMRGGTRLKIPARGQSTSVKMGKHGAVIFVNKNGEVIIRKTWRKK